MGLWALLKSFFIPRHPKASFEAAPIAPPKKESPIKLDPAPPWILVARQELGVKEFEGAKNNPRILEYFKSTEYHPNFEDHWCSAFVCWVLEKSGYKSTKKAYARSFEWYGERLVQPVYGCIAVFWRVSKQSGKGHVGFYVGENESNVFVLGGNQGDMVKVSSYPKTQLLSYRWPVKP